MMNKAGRIEIIIKGHLDRTWMEWHKGLHTTINSNGTTSITGIVKDQAEFYGIINKLKPLGVKIIKFEFTQSQNQEVSDEK